MAATSHRGNIRDAEVEPILLYLERAREKFGPGELGSDALLLALLLVKLDRGLGQ